MNSKRTKQILAAIIALALALRLVFIRHISLEMDEIWSLNVSMLPPREIIRALMDQEALPLLFFIMHFWTKVSSGALWVHILPVLFSTAGVWLIYKIGKGMFDSRVGLVASFFCAVSPLLVDYAHYTRYSSLCMFLALLTLLFTQKAVDAGEIKDGSCKNNRAVSLNFFALAVCLTACIYTHFFMFFWLAAMNVFFFFFTKNRKLIIKWIVTEAFVILCFLPWAANTIRLGESSLVVLSVPQALARLRHRFFYLPDMTTGLITGKYINIHDDTAAIIVFRYVILLLLVAGAFGLIKVVAAADYRTKKNILSLLCLYLSTLVSALIVFTFCPGLLFIPQYFIYLAALLILLFAVVIVKAKTHAIRFGFSVLLAVVLIVPLIDSYRLYVSCPDAVDATDRINREAREGDVVLLIPNPAENTVRYYLRKPLPVISVPRPFNLWRYNSAELYVQMDDQRMSVIAGRLKNARRVWFYKVDTNYDFDPGKRIDDFLGKYFIKKNSMWFIEEYPMSASLSLYVKKVKEN